MAQEASLLSASAKSLSFLVALQLFSRIFTSVLNGALFRFASPAVFGTAAIQFELVLSTILFLSREGVRNAILRTSSTGTTSSKDDEDEAHVKQLNLTFLPLIVGVPLSLLTSFIYLSFASDEVRGQPRLIQAVGLYALAALVELASEPMHNRAMLELKTNIRVRAEGLGITAKSCITLLVLYLDAQRSRTNGKATVGEWALIAFALGQLAYSSVVYLNYARVYGVPLLRKPKSKQKAKPQPSGYFDKRLLGLSLTMTGQSVIKHILTEGDKLLLTFFSPLHDQGGYALAANYGSLLARIVFQPLEETLRVFFSRLLSNRSPDSSSKNGPVSGPSKAAVAQASKALRTLLSVQIAVSILFVIFGSSYIDIALPMVLPPTFLSTSAPKVLGAWVWYIPVLAINGGLEAFWSSVAGRKEIGKQSRWMFAFSVIYVSTAITLYQLGFGDKSLIYANCLNLGARIAYCLVFAKKWFRDHSTARTKGTQASATSEFTVSSVLPPPLFILVASASLAIIKLSESHFKVFDIVAHLGKKAVFSPKVLGHIGVGGLLGLTCVGVWLLGEGQEIVREFIGKTQKVKPE